MYAATVQSFIADYYYLLDFVRRTSLVAAESDCETKLKECFTAALNNSLMDSIGRDHGYQPIAGEMIGI